MDRLTSASVFIEVAQWGSLTTTADRLNMSITMVSRHVAAIEEWLGQRLLNRTTRRVSLTDSGQSALDLCKQLVALAQELENSTRERSLEPQGRLRIACSASYAEAQLTACVLDFQSLYPGVDVEMLVTDRTQDLVEDRIDLAIRISNTLDPNLVSRRLATCRSVLCASPVFIQRHGSPIKVQDLQSMLCIGHSFLGGTMYRFKHDGQLLELPIQWKFFANETSVVRRAALSGAGIAMLPTYYVAEYLKRGELVAVLPDYEPEALGIHAIYLSRKHQTLTLRYFIDFLVERLRDDS